MKTIALKILGADSEPVDLVISPGATALSVLTQLGLAGHLLSAKGSTTCFSPEEAIFDHVQDGDLLYACAPVCELY